MEPIAETLQALEEVDLYLDEGSLLDQITETASRAEQLVPGLVGVSLGYHERGLTFTLVASHEQIAALDAVQYATSGPCVDAIHLGHGITTPDGLLDERQWHQFARASAASGVRSTLTLPVLDGDVVVSTVNLYGREEDTFAGMSKVLADVFGAWAPGAVANADLSFATRRAAEQAPTQLRHTAVVDTATGILASERSISVDEARARLHESAARAGVPVHRLAALLVDAYLDE